MSKELVFIIAILIFAPIFIWATRQNKKDQKFIEEYEKHLEYFCPICKKVTKFSSTNMMFVEYCRECGGFFRSLYLSKVE